jgi:ribosomal protein S18 acetylase RimI-like enzyme
MEIKIYSEADEAALFDMMRGEGDEWASYYGDEVKEKYRKALKNSISYVAYENEVLCGYVRCRDDDGYGVYIYDLLVKKAYRGRAIGRKLMEEVCADYPEEIVYVMSDVDEYYKKQGYRRIGSIFVVHDQKQQQDLNYVAK